MRKSIKALITKQMKWTADNGMTMDCHIELPQQWVSAKRLLAREGINAEQLARDLKSFDCDGLMAREDSNHDMEACSEYYELPSLLGRHRKSFGTKHDTTYEDVFPAEATSVEEYLQQSFDCTQVHEMAMVSAVQEAQKGNLRSFDDFMMHVLEASYPNFIKRCKSPKTNLDQLEALSQKLKARTMRAESPTQSIAATRLLAHDGINAEQLARDLKSFELKSRESRDLLFGELCVALHRVGWAFRITEALFSERCYTQDFFALPYALLAPSTHCNETLGLCAYMSWESLQEVDA
ncbi:Uncharacterized protein QJS10_CPA05g00695 [Acorus calamus]|uniref:Uncharacterized protein n=1 Tax=Acorus calamus TaxID=4465 RepID=A0AAV9ESE1_ACOCL|nr:Uncharacterized protein QJS10_CPA05g00695 [Acorus calamus]